MNRRADPAYQYEVALYGVWLFERWGYPLVAHAYAMEVLAMELNP